MSATLTARTHQHASGVYKEVAKLKDEQSVTLTRDSGRKGQNPMVTERQLNHSKTKTRPKG